MKTLVVLWSVGCVGGCGLFLPHRDLLLIPPSLPRHWDSAFSDVGIVVRTAPGEVAARAAAWGPIGVQIDKGTNVPVTVHPVVAGREDLLHPAGAVFSIDCRIDPCSGRETLIATWERGFCATVLQAVRRAGGDCGAVDAEALNRAAERACPADRWWLDPWAVARSLLEGKSPAESLERPSTAALRIPMPAGHESRDWVSASALDTKHYAAELRTGGQAWLIVEDVALGAHRFISEDGSASIDAWVSVAETAWVVREIGEAVPR